MECLECLLLCTIDCIFLRASNPGHLAVTRGTYPKSSTKSSNYPIFGCVFDHKSGGYQFGDLVCAIVAGALVSVVVRMGAPFVAAPFADGEGRKSREWTGVCPLPMASAALAFCFTHGISFGASGSGIHAVGLSTMISWLKCVMCLYPPSIGSR